MIKVSSPEQLIVLGQTLGPAGSTSLDLQKTTTNC